MSIKICINLYFNNELRFRIAVGLIQNVYDKPKQKLAHQPQTKLKWLFVKFKKPPH